MRGLARTKRSAEFVCAAKLSGVSEPIILVRHVLPNVMGPVFVLGALNLSAAVMTEATLSFLGVGVPPTTPSLGTLIRIGNDFIFSGEYWIALFPSARARRHGALRQPLGRPASRRRESRFARRLKSDEHREDKFMTKLNTTGTPVLDVRELTVRRADGAVILEDVSLAVRAGEILGLVGESSAGKSMIGSAVAGLLPAASRPWTAHRALRRSARHPGRRGEASDSRREDRHDHAGSALEP